MTVYLNILRIILTLHALITIQKSTFLFVVDVLEYVNVSATEHL